MMKRVFLGVSAALILLSGCYYDNVDELYPGSGLFIPCDTTANVTYSGHVSKIMTNFCNSCHSSSVNSGNVTLDNYNSVYAVAVSGQLLGSTWHQGAYTPMPPNSQLDSCYLKQVKIWINNGAPNN